MERRYLVAALAMIATFAGFSRGFQSLQQLSQQHSQHGQAIAAPQCGSVPAIVTRWFAKIRNEFQPGNPEEAQVLAELNLPLAAMQAKVAEKAAEQAQAAAEVASENAMREAERARRDAMRMHEQMARDKNWAVMPVVVDLQGLNNLDQRIQIRTAALAEHMDSRNVRMQVAAAKLAAVCMKLDNSGKRHSPCRSRAQMQ
jgi:hypothetical protein